jgi:hypothetical protein
LFLSNLVQLVTSHVTIGPDIFVSKYFVQTYNFLQEEKLAKMGSLKILLFLASWSLDVKVVNIEGST